MQIHKYETLVKWTGNLGEGTRNYRAYTRNHTIYSEAKYAEIKGSSDPDFRGDQNLYNPEELFISSLSACHMLWYLHLCSESGIVVTEYLDRAEGVMELVSGAGGKFKSVCLRPEVTITKNGSVEMAMGLHQAAGEKCFIANSCNFPVNHQPVIRQEK